MVEVNFKIILVPQEILNVHERKELLFRVKSTLRNCGLTNISITFSQFKKHEDDGYPQLKEFAFDVQAEIIVSDEITKATLYEEFCIKWKKNCNLDICSYVEFFENDCFVNSSQPSHELMCEEMSFGVLPYNGFYYKYSDDIFRYIQVSFYHDTRNVLVKCSVGDYDEFELTFSYDNIRNLFVDIDYEPSHLYFDLINPPIIFRIHKGKRHRSNCIKTMSDLKILIQADIIGRANVLSLKLVHSQIFREILASIHYQCAEKSIFYSNIIRQSKSKPLGPVIKAMHFGCYYLINAIFKRNFVTVSQTSDIDTELRRLYSWSLQEPECLEKALASVLMVIDSGKILNFWRAVQLQYEYFIKNKDEIKFKHYIIPPHCFMIRRVVITPTRQLFWPAEIMFGNRFLRSFDPDYSIRVSFREDNMSKLTINLFSADSEVIEMCVTNPMRNGLRIGSRKYEFLAWSSSQLRDHGVWMYAENGERETAAHIRDWIGDFSHIHCIPKYMARMGQCFSSTEDAIYIPLNHQFVKTEDDIEGGYDRKNLKPYCFSDGIGKISPELASKVYDRLGHDKLCSAFQIRYRGYKGVLVIDPTLEGEQIIFRKSMKKFDCSNSSNLEIVKASKPSTLRLNRPLISLLDGLGVNHKIFERLQEVMLQNLTDMMFNEEKAANFLQEKTPTHLCDFKDIASSGIYLTTEPFFKSLLLAFHRHRIEKIKTRAQIDIDPSKGRNMLGVLDETNTLNYGEVFVQYSKDVAFGETTRDTIVHVGDVLVTKSPCMYPGDVRKFKAVDVPALHHIVDCIAFPQQGHRPHPNEMAGSDLDGDEYAVIWDPDLFFKTPNKKPAHFPAVNSYVFGNIGISEIIDFLEDYIRNDTAGLIGIAHLVRADKSGIFSRECQSIARKMSFAVDFAKNGQIEQLLEREKLRKYPDFMESDRHMMYKSNKTLGKLYRTCKYLELENEAASMQYENVQCDPDLVYPGWEKYKDNAIMAKKKYSSLIKCILRTYGIQHEAELVSGAFTKLHCRFKEKKSHYEVEKMTIACIKHLNECMYREFLEEFTDADANDFMASILRKASAWYLVTYSVPDTQFLSFPWIVSKYLVQIKLINKPLATPPSISPAIMKLDQKILDYNDRHLLPDWNKSEIWNEYRILCDPDVFDRPLQIVIFWGLKEGIIEIKNARKQRYIKIYKRYEQREFIMNVHTQLILHVAQTLGFVTKDDIFETAKTVECSSGLLLLEYLKFWSNFRIRPYRDLEKLLSFPVKNFKKLSKRAFTSYYQFGISGALDLLEIDKQSEKKMIQMKAIYKNRAAFPSPKTAEYVLKKSANVHAISVREIPQTKLVCIAAKGTVSAIRNLKVILEESDKSLKKFTTRRQK